MPFLVAYAIDLMKWSDMSPIPASFLDLQLAGVLHQKIQQKNNQQKKKKKNKKGSNIVPFAHACVGIMVSTTSTREAAGKFCIAQSCKSCSNSSNEE
jgi:hypothetical protein